MKLEIIDHISDPGSADKRNDDSLCMAPAMIAVFDGATGVGDEPLFPEEESDAAWIADLAARMFADAAPRASPGELVRRVADAAREAVAKKADLETLPRYAWPNAGFEMVRLHGAELELSGLGDCSAYVLQPDGDLIIHTALPAGREQEMAAARALLDQTGGYGPEGGIIRQGAVLEALRRGRARQNTPDGGVWTIGLSPEASGHVAVQTAQAMPGALVLVMTDGFSALAEMYRRHSQAGLVEAAAREGLAALLEELRHVERALDPQAEQFARFKRSDDATAILARID